MKEFIDKKNNHNVSFEAALDYEKKIPIMLSKVNELMERINSEKNLIQSNPLSVMSDNHKHHANFMINIFKLNDYQLLGHTLEWVINSYVSRGFKKEYFEFELSTWMEIIEETIDNKYSKEILDVYSLMKSYINSFDKSFKIEDRRIVYPFEVSWKNKKNKFTNLLLEGDTIGALNYAKSITEGKDSLQEFYLKVVTYSMYDIGIQWENGLISVAQEHLATSIVMRIMALLYMSEVICTNTKGKAIITACSNEYHEVGARIIADMLELDGWDVKYFGANTPEDELIKAIKSIHPVFVGMSITMVFNIEKLIKTIEKIRSVPEIANTKIMAGGYAFNNHIDSLNKINADEIIFFAEDSIKIAKKWWDEQF